MCNNNLQYVCVIITQILISLVYLLSQQIVDKIRSSDFSSLHQLAMENYRDIFINYLVSNENLN